jgi:hypothetical protein
MDWIPCLTASGKHTCISYFGGKSPVSFLDTVPKAHLIFVYDAMQINSDSVRFRNPRTFKIFKYARPSFSFDSSKKDLYEPYFHKMFNTHSLRVKVGDYPEADYQVTVAIKRLEPGYHILGSRRRAIINADLSICSRQPNSNCLWEVSNHKAVGIEEGRNNEDFNNRILSAYGQLAHLTVKKSGINELSGISKKSRDSSQNHMQSFFTKETFGKTYYSNKMAEKMFRTMGIIPAGLGMMVMLFGGMIENPYATPDEEKMLQLEKRKYILAGTGIAVSSVPFFILSRHFRKKADNTRIFLVFDPSPLRNNPYGMLPAIGIKTTF